MSAELLYWSFMGAAFVAAGGIAVAVMLMTQKLGRAFFLSLTANAVIHAAASIWWYSVSTEPVKHTLGRIFFYGIAFVNIQVLIVFALLSMRKQPESHTDGQ